MKRFVLLTAILLAINPAFAENTLSQQATAFYSDNNHQKAMEMLLQIDEKERTAKDWLLMGNLLDDNGDLEQAVFMYQKAISVDPKFYKAYYNIGNICLEKNKYNMAIGYYKKAAKYNQTNPYIFYNLACAYMKLGKLKDAKNALIKSVTIKNDIPEVHYNLAYVYKSLNKPKIAQTYLANYNKLTESAGY